MTTYVIKRSAKVKVKYLDYSTVLGVTGSFVDELGATELNDLYDILVIDGCSSKLIESCVNNSISGNKYSFSAVRVRDL